MSEGVDYAKRAIQRREARKAGRKSTMSTEERLTLQCRILADRLALALHVMTAHEQFIRHETTVEWIKYLEDWAVELTKVEPRPKRGRKWQFDFYRGQQRYRFLKNAVRGMLRGQIAELTGVSDGSGEDAQGGRGGEDSVPDYLGDTGGAADRDDVAQLS